MCVCQGSVPYGLSQKIRKTERVWALLNEEKRKRRHPENQYKMWGDNDMDYWILLLYIYAFVNPADKAEKAGKQEWGAATRGRGRAERCRTHRKRKRTIAGEYVARTESTINGLYVLGCFCPTILAVFFSQCFTTKYHIYPLKISIILPPLSLWLWKGFTLILDYVCHLDLRFICGNKHSDECTVCPVIAIFQWAFCSVMIS